jgi:hypothetical protein
MAVNPSNPKGLVPFQRLDGAVWNDSGRVYYVPAAVAHALFVGDPVIKTAGSADANGVNGVDLASAGDGDQITGVVIGFLGNCAAGAANPSFFGLSGSPGPAFRPASTSLDWYVIVNDDPETLFEIQSSDNVAIPTAAIVGKNVDLVSGAGSAFTGFSGWEFDPNSAATSATHQLRIISAVQAINNVVGEANCKFLVQINTHTELPHQAGI